MFTILEKRGFAMSRRVALLAAVVVASVVLPRPPAAAAAAATEVVTLPGCTSHCGNINIPHPFGVEPGCYLPRLNVTCRNDSSVGHHGSPKLFLGDGTVEVLEISIPNATFAYFPGSNGSYSKEPITSGTWSGALEEGGVYSLALERNRMFVSGCNVQIFLVGYLNRTVSTCTALCNWDEDYQMWTFPVPGSGVSFCEATILNENISFGFSPLWLNMNGAASPRLEVGVWILERDLYPDDLGNQWTRLPAVLDWRVLNHSTCHRTNWSSASCLSEHSYCQYASSSPDSYKPDAHICLCDEGYQGNPYIPNGCRGNIHKQFHDYCNMYSYDPPYHALSCRSQLALIMSFFELSTSINRVLLTAHYSFRCQRMRRHTPVMGSATTLKAAMSASALKASRAMLLYQMDAKVRYHIANKSIHIWNIVSTL
jgi:hypothetical protein